MSRPNLSFALENTSRQNESEEIFPRLGGYPDLGVQISARSADLVTINEGLINTITAA